MSNPFDETRRAVAEAEDTLRATDLIANDMARLLVGRLRKVKGYNVLASLKKELKDFNAHTRTWKN